MGSISSEPRAKGIAQAPALPSVAVDVDWGTAYELVLGLRMFVDDEDPGSYAVGPEWFDGVRSRLSAATLAAIERYSGGEEILFGYLLALAADAPRPRDAASLIAVVEKLPPLDLRRLQLGYRLQTYRGAIEREVIAAAAAGDTAAAGALLNGCADWQQAAYAHVLASDADEEKRLLLEACRGWYEAILQPDERSTVRSLRASARATRALAERLPAEELIDVVTQGIRYAAEPGIHRILLVPHIVSRPWSIFTESGETKIVCHGVAETHVSGDRPPDPLVAAYKALGDETRLRILRRLAEGPATLQELTQLVGLAKSTVHGHLLVLRTAGLVIANLSKSGYTLRRETIARSAALLETYLEGAED
jgi:DNA-binding transcriptional ArsR family regulator